VNYDHKIIFKNTVILFFRLLLTSFLGLFTARFVIQGLGASDFGLYSVVGGIVIVMSFLSTVMSSTTFRFLAVEIGKGSNGDSNKVFNISFVIHICLSVVLIIIAETFGVYYIKNHLNVLRFKIPDALYVLRLSSFTMAFSILSIPFQGLITAEEKFYTQSIIEVIKSILTFLVAYFLLYYFGNRIRLYSLLISAVSIISSLVLLIYCLIKFKDIVRWKFQKSYKAYKEMIGYTGWLMFGTLGWVGQRQGSDLLVNSFFGTTINATMGIATQVNSMVMVLAKNLGQAAIPQITKSVSRNESDRTKYLVAYISKYSYFLMLIPALPILLETEFLLKLWLGRYPPYTVIFCQLIIINALIESFSTGLPTVIMATGKVKIFMLFGGLISFLGVPITYGLFRISFEPYLVLIIFIMTGVVNLVVSQILLKRIIKYDISFFIKTACFKMINVSIFLIPLFILKDLFQPSLYRFILIIFSSFIWLFVIVYFVGLNNNERYTIKRYVLNILNKIY
jgi:O-antigen/teichoic acid export membrane protein